jgi:hypothetical protein
MGLRPGGSTVNIPAALDTLYAELSEGDFLVGSGGSEVGVASDHAAAVRTAIGASGVTSGVDTSRPTASTGIIGSIYTATDVTGGVYLCESDGAGGARWRNVISGLLDSTRVAGATTNPIGVTARATPSTGTIVCFFGASATPGSVQALMGTFISAGWMLGIGNSAGDRGLLSLYRDGQGWTNLTGATITGALNTLHALAISCTPTTLRWSLDGGAVGSASVSGTITGSAPFYIAAGGSAATAAWITAGRVLTTAVGDADLQALTGSAARAAFRIPAVSATTIAIDYHAARAFPGLAAAISGTQPDWMYGTAVQRVSSW